MRCVISGGSGFVGSNLIEACLKKGWDVVNIDNFSTGSWDLADTKRYEHLPGRYTLLPGDVTTEAPKLAEAFRLHNTEVIFHLAALPRVSFSVDEPLKAHMNNAYGTLNILEAAKLGGVKRVIFSCSSSIYGGVAQFPTPETAPAHPKSPYALQKQSGAEYCRLFSELYGLETCSLIYFNLMGILQFSNSSYATVVPAFFEAAVKGNKCIIHGSGTQSRDFCDVENAVSANLLAAEYKGNLLGDRFNIACGETHTVLDVYEAVKKYFPGLEKRHTEPRLGDPIKSHADIGKAKDVLKYKVLINFEQSIKKTYDWWKMGCPI